MKIVDKFYDTIAGASWDACLWLSYKYDNGCQIDVWNLKSGKRKVNQYNQKQQLTHTVFVDRGSNEELWDNLNGGMLLSDIKSTKELKIIDVANYVAGQKAAIKKICQYAKSEELVDAVNRGRYDFVVSKKEHEAMQFDWSDWFIESVQRSDMESAYELTIWLQQFVWKGADIVYTFKK